MVPSGHNLRLAGLDEVGQLRTDATAATVSPTSSSAVAEPT
jgi:hypothetical protein